MTPLSESGDAIRRLPPYALLATLAVPFIVLEPAKLFAICWGAVSHPVQSVMLRLIAQVAATLTCERIFHVGYEPLMHIGWFNRPMTWVIKLRDLSAGPGQRASEKPLFPACARAFLMKWTRQRRQVAPSTLAIAALRPW